MDVRSQVRHYLNSVIAQEIGDDDDIFALGIVDSLFAIQLVQFVETEFSLVAETMDLDIANFCSIAAITRFVQGKRSELTSSNAHT